jgi:hypothetical protein
MVRKPACDFEPVLFSTCPLAPPLAAAIPFERPAKYVRPIQLQADFAHKDRLRRLSRTRSAGDPHCASCSPGRLTGQVAPHTRLDVEPHRR